MSSPAIEKDGARPCLKVIDFQSDTEKKINSGAVERDMEQVRKSFSL